jgi:hypothetical protein
MKLMFPEKRELENIEKENCPQIFKIEDETLNELEKTCLGNGTERITKVYAGSRTHIPVFATKMKEMLFREYTEGVKEIKGNSREDVELFNSIARHFGHRLIQIQLKFQKVAVEYEILQGVQQALEDKYNEIKETVKRLNVVKAARELRRRFNNWKRQLKESPAWNYCRIEKEQTSKINEFSEGYFNPSISAILNPDRDFQSGYYMRRHKYKICVELWKSQERESWFVISVILPNKQDWVDVNCSREPMEEVARRNNLNVLIGGSRYDYRWFDGRIKLERKREKDALNVLEKIKQVSFKMAEASYKMERKLREWRLDQIRRETGEDN